MSPLEARLQRLEARWRWARDRRRQEGVDRSAVLSRARGYSVRRAALDTTHGGEQHDSRIVHVWC
jgi:hypothetical protein